MKKFGFKIHNFVYGLRRTKMHFFPFNAKFCVWVAAFDSQMSCYMFVIYCYLFWARTIDAIIPKGQIKPKADWRAVDSSKKRTNEFVFFCREKQKSKNWRIYCVPIRPQSAYGFIWPLVYGLFGQSNMDSQEGNDCTTK